MLSPIFAAAGSMLKGEVRVVNFLMVGGLNTIFGYGVFALMLWLGLHYSVAIAIATLGFFSILKVSALSYSAYTTTRRLFGSYWCTLVTYCINVIGVAVLLRVGINTHQGGLLMILTLAPLAYLLNCQYVFKHE